MIAVEDRVSEVVAQRISEAAGLTVCQTIGLKGNSYLRNKANALNQTARGFPILLLTDQDRHANCPASIIGDWLASQAEPNLLFRVAVMEVESWVLADAEPLGRFLGVPLNKITRAPDLLADPKAHLVELARRSRKRRIREDIVPTPTARSTRKVGAGYNSLVPEFVLGFWRPAEARRHSPSLHRAMKRLEELARRRHG